MDVSEVKKYKIPQMLGLNIELYQIDEDVFKSLRSKSPYKEDELTGKFSQVRRVEKMAFIANKNDAVYLLYSGVEHWNEIEYFKQRTEYIFQGANIYGERVLAYKNDILVEFINEMNSKGVELDEKLRSIDQLGHSLSGVNKEVFYALRLGIAIYLSEVFIKHYGGNYELIFNKNAKTWEPWVRSKKKHLIPIFKVPELAYIESKDMPGGELPISFFMLDMIDDANQ